MIMAARKGFVKARVEIHLKQFFKAFFLDHIYHRDKLFRTRGQSITLIPPVQSVIKVPKPKQVMELVAKVH